MQYRFSELVQRIFKYGDILNNYLTPDKELNILIYWTTFLRHHIQELYTIKNGPFLAHPV